MQEYNEDGRGGVLSELSALRQRVSELEKSDLEKRRTIGELREEAGRLNKVVNAARDAIIMIDEKGEICLWSESAVQIFGYTAEEAVGRNLHGLLVPGGLREAYGRRFAEFVSTGSGPVVGKVVELTALRKDGKEIPVEVSVAPVRAGDSWHSVGIVRDVTERKRAEQALRRSEATLKSVFSAAPVGIVVTNGKRTAEWVNDAMTTITGFTVEEQRRMGARVFYATPEEYDRVGRVIVDGIERYGIGATDTKWVRKDGEVRDIHLRGAAVDAGDPSSGLVFAAVDITDAKKSEEALQESEAKYRTVVENSLVGVCIIQDGVIRFANGRWCEIHGYEYEEVMNGLKVRDLVHPEDRASADEIIRRQQTGGFDDGKNEFRAFRKDGSLITVKVFGRTMIYRGRPATISTVIDITRERMLENQLLQSQKMEAIGMLAGGVAHDFNNILTAMTGYATLLQMKIGREDSLSPYIDQILSASGKGANLTKSLLAFSRQQPLSLKPVSLNNILGDTTKLLKRLLTEDVALETIPSPDDIIIMADPTHLDQILFNLTANASDAMPDGGRLTIETRLVEMDDEIRATHGVDRPGKYALMTVSDTGKGMDEKTMGRIFEPFFTTKEAGKGTGLGLATVYGIVRQHEGYISVRSRPGSGTTFFIYLPAVAKAAHHESPVAEEARRGNETVLVAEDNMSVRHLIRDVLTRYGYRVIEAEDGTRALDEFYRNRGSIDLLLLDSVMPGKNGRAVYDEIHSSGSPTRALFMSGYTRDVVLDKGIEDKTFHFISKPITPVELLRKVREVLDLPE